MATSKLTLYKTRLTEDKRWKLDDMDSYLATCDSKVIEGDKYIAPTLSNDVTIPMEQRYILSNFGYNYAKLEQSDGSKYYYFITNPVWLSVVLAKITLKLDTLNFPMATPTFTDKTRIIREHQQRWKKTDSGFMAIVDKYNENLNPAEKDQLVATSVIDANNMYLIQMSKNATTPDTTDKHPYSTYLCYNTDYYYADAGSGGNSTYNVSTIYNNWSYKVTGLYNQGNGLIYSNGTALYNATIGSSTKDFNGTTGVLRAIKFIVTNSTYAQGVYTVTLKVIELYYTGDTYPYSYLGSWDNTYTLGSSTSNSYVQLHNSRFMYQTKDTGYIRDSCTSLDVLMNVSARNEIDAGNYESLVATRINDLDRTNESIMAIYPVPYIKLTSNDLDFKVGYNLLQFKNFALERSLGNLQIRALSRETATSVKSDYSSYYESKLYSKEFSDIGIYYQSECLFNFDATRFISNEEPVIQTSMVVSEDAPQTIRFFFQCSQYSFLSDFEKYQYFTNKYAIPLFTNEWTDYVREGYNYDVAEKERQKKLSIINTAISGVQAITSLSEPVTKLVKGLMPSRYDILTQGLNGNPLLPTREEEQSLGRMVTSQGIGNIGSMVNAISAIDSSNKSYQHSLNSKVNSKTSINGTGDWKTAVDNKVTYQLWQPREHIRNELTKVFHLTGYSHPLIEKPNTTSRYWFNYIQCQPDWDESTINEIPKEILDDLNQKYSNGVTVFHYHDGYDLEQKYENWENSLL